MEPDEKRTAARTDPTPEPWDARARRQTRHIAWAGPTAGVGLFCLGRDAAIPFAIAAAAAGSLALMIILMQSRSRALAWLGILTAIPMAYGFAMLPMALALGVGWSLQLVRMGRPVAGACLFPLFAAGAILAWVGAAWSALSLHGFLALRDDRE